jgi:anti-anti-sigma factor
MHDDIQTTLAGEAGAVLVVRLPEDLNHQTADRVRACVASRLPEHDEAGVVLDASSLTLITSIGVAALLQVQEIARERGCRMCLVHLGAEAHGFLAMLRLEDKFARFASEDAGVLYCEARR